MKLSKRATFPVIFLAPVLLSGENGGCASTPEPGPLNTKQIVQTISGNTVKLADRESYALVGKDGKLTGLNTPKGGKKGNWRVSDNGVLCARWELAGDSKENCDAMRYLGKKQYKWGGSTFVILKGNPKGL